MRYTLSQAEAFYWVARLGGFRAAAGHLNLTQPTVSLRLRELERNLGGELFDRSGYRPELTPLGRSIYPDMERMLSIADHIQKSVRNEPHESRLLRIGAAETFAAVILPGLLSAMERKHPALQTTVTVELSMQLEKMLLEREIDIAFLAQPRVQDKITIVPLWSVEHVWVVGKDCPLEGQIATPEALVDMPIYATSCPSGLFTSMLVWFGGQGLKPRRVTTCNPITMIAWLASAGGGAGLIPREMVAACGRELQLRVLEANPPIMPHNICAMWREDDAGTECAYMTDLARQLIGQIKNRNSEALTANA